MMNCTIYLYLCLNMILTLPYPFNIKYKKKIVLVTLVFGCNIYMWSKNGSKELFGFVDSAFWCAFYYFFYLLFIVCVFYGEFPNFIRFCFSRVFPSTSRNKPYKLILKIFPNQLRLYFIFPFLLGVSCFLFFI